MHLTREQWQKVDEVFHAASQLAGEGRHHAIAALSLGDVAVADVVRRLLVADAGPTSVDEGIGKAAAQLLSPAGPSLPANLQFGPYLVTGILGEGGMGVVYRAVRDDVGAEVALKVLWDAPLSPDRRSRFDHERRILAQLRHPGIVPLYDAGVQPDGTPWFAMELVDGTNIISHVGEHRLRVRDRLLLFSRVCAAVRAAHQRLVVHGDLKPSNILVSRDGRVRLLDFGVAARLDDASDAPGRHRLLTPAYAAPERRAGQSPTVQNDVYALGVVLRELLCAAPPGAMGDGALPPSRLSAVRYAAEGRGEDWDDLDVLCQAALAADAAMRYPSVEALQRDVDLYLESRPLAVRPRTRGYLIRKFMHRRGREVAITAILALSGVTAGIVHTRALAAARNAALAEAARSGRLREFLENLFHGRGAPPESIDSIRVATLVDHGIREARALTSDRATQLQMYETLGVVSARLGHLERADSLLRTAAMESARLHGDADARTLRVRTAWAGVLMRRARGDSAETMLRAAAGDAERTLGARHPLTAEVQLALGTLLRGVGRLSEARSHLVRVEALHRDGDTLSLEYVRALRELGNLESDDGKVSRADSLWRRALPIARHLFGPRHPEVGFLLSNLGSAALHRGEYAGAEAYQREALDQSAEWYGLEHPVAAAAELVLGQTLVRADRPAEALASLRHAEGVLERSATFGPQHPSTAVAHGAVGSALSVLGRHDEALRAFEKSVRVLSVALGAEDPNTLTQRANVATALAALGRVDSAVTLLDDLVARASRALGARAPLVAGLKATLGGILAGQGRHADAATTLSDAVAALDAIGEAGRPQALAARAQLVRAYVALGDSVAARRVRDELARMR